MRYRYMDDGRRWLTFKMTRERRRLAPEHEEIILRVQRQQLEETLRQSAARRRELGLPELGYGPPPPA